MIFLVQSQLYTYILIQRACNIKQTGKINIDQNDQNMKKAQKIYKDIIKKIIENVKNEFSNQYNTVPDITYPDINRLLESYLLLDINLLKLLKNHNNFGDK